MFKVEQRVTEQWQEEFNKQLAIKMKEQGRKLGAAMKRKQKKQEKGTAEVIIGDIVMEDISITLPLIGERRTRPQ